MTDLAKGIFLGVSIHDTSQVLAAAMVHSDLHPNHKTLEIATITKIIDKDISAFKFSGLDKFDVIFLDPPFKYKNIDNLIISLRNLNLLKKNGLIVLHRHRNDKEILTPEFKILKKQNYGISNIFFGY